MSIGKNQAFSFSKEKPVQTKRHGNPPLGRALPTMP
jgi:hypothetical protein